MTLIHAVLISVVVFGAIMMADSRARVAQMIEDKKNFDVAMDGWRRSINSLKDTTDSLEQANALIEQLQDERK